MEKIFTNESWKQILEILPKKKPRFAAVAYVSSGCPIDFRKGDTLICDASERAIKYGETDANTLKMLHGNGVEIFSLENLHAKVLVCEQYCVVGSSNLSDSSENYLYEGTLITDSIPIRAQILGLMHSFKDKAQKLDPDSIRILSGIKVQRRLGYVKKPEPIEIGYRKWFVSAPEVFDEEFPEEERELIERGQTTAAEVTSCGEEQIGWITPEESPFRKKAKPGDLVILVSETKQGETSVLMPLPIILRQDETPWKTRFYYQDSEKTKEISWAKFEKALKKLGISGITSNTTRFLREKEYEKMINIGNK
jgi:hypothetical protein